MCRRAVGTRSGWYLFFILAGVLMLLGIAHDIGLAMWAAEGLGRDDKIWHGVTGLVLSLALAWQVGKGRLGMGFVGLFLGLLIGPAGELLQQYASTRGGHVGDAVWHAGGTVAATAVYLLAVGARQCESPNMVTLTEC
jgi:hypothetical protein